MPLDSQAHIEIKRATQRRRTDAATERRASGGPVYRKVPIIVSLIETTDAAGAPLLLASSDLLTETGRYFRVAVERGRWVCSCGSFRQVGGCHHVGHLAM